jgi:transposase
MDNLAAHKVAFIREAVAAKGAELAYLPAHSPDLDPIEQVFAKLKALLRREGARRVDDLCNAIGRCLDAFTPTECANDLANSGYVPR